jgi:hypothetical protein
MFQFYIYLELSYAQIASSHCTLLLLHTLKMMANVVVTLLPVAKCLALLYSQLFFFFFNSFVSFSYFRLCLLLCASFSLATLYNFSITLSALMLLCILELQKHTTFDSKRKQISIVIPFFSILELLIHHIHFLTCRHFIINGSSLKL